jgi:hypothetical protein
MIGKLSVGKDSPKGNRTNLLTNLNLLLSLLVDQIKEGVMVVSGDLQPVYLNLKAKEICDRLWHGNSASNRLPPIISDIYDRLIKDFAIVDEVFVIDYPISRDHIIRIRASCLMLGREVDYELSRVLGNPPASLSENCPWLVFFLEDRNASLQEELQIEQKKYNLTDRETEILKLLSQTYTYQEIAQTLHISLNTVKFHAKNIYSKKRIYLGRQ